MRPGIIDRDPDGILELYGIRSITEELADILPLIALMIGSSSRAEFSYTTWHLELEMMIWRNSVIIYALGGFARG